jgi:hypothetical protein
MEMRRFLVVPFAAVLLVVLAAPVAAGQTVYNSSGSVTVAEGDWSSFDEATGAATYGYAAAYRAQGDSQAYLDFSQETDRWVLCSDGGTPDDPSDDAYGLVASFTYGSGPATLDVGKSYSTAGATATVDLSVGSFDECAGTKDFTTAEGVRVSLDLSGTSPLVKTSDHGSFHVPNQFNGHSTYRTTYREAEGSVTVGGQSIEAYGAIGKVSWSEHSNG